jgi:hypothetical protein
LSANAQKKFVELLSQKSEKVGEMTEAITLNIETYMQEGTGNGAKGVSRVVIINEHGQRLLDTQIKLINFASTKGR